MLICVCTDFQTFGTRFWTCNSFQSCHDFGFPSPRSSSENLKCFWKYIFHDTFALGKKIGGQHWKKKKTETIYILLLNISCMKLMSYWQSTYQSLLHRSYWNDVSVRKIMFIISDSQHKQAVNHRIRGVCIRASHINFTSACVNIFLLSQIINRRRANASLAFLQNVYHGYFKLFIGKSEL